MATRMDPVETDGRRLRRSRNRDAAVDALLALYREGRYDPSAAEIAERAGLSPRSLFRYFDDVDDLVHAAIQRQAGIILPVLERSVDVGLPLDQRIESFVDLRLAFFDTVGKVGRVARLRAPFQPEVLTNLTTLRSYLRQQIAAAFAPELERIGAPTSGDVLSALDVLCSYEAHELMAEDQGLDPAARRSTLVRAISSLIGATS